MVLINNAFQGVAATVGNLRISFTSEGGIYPPGLARIYGVQNVR
jgi:hypothetical protein